MLETQGGGARRQTVLLSATLTAQVEKLAGLALNSPVRLDASNISEDELVIPQSLHQHYVVTPAKLRLVTLGAFIHWKCKVKFFTFARQNFIGMLQKNTWTFQVLSKTINIKRLRRLCVSIV